MTQPEALLLSIAVEAMTAWPLVAGLRWGRGARAALAAAAATLLIHWPAWSGCLWLEQHVGYGAAVVAVEAGVIAIEWLAYRVIVPLPPAPALLASTIANAASTLAGLALYALGVA